MKKLPTKMFLVFSFCLLLQMPMTCLINISVFILHANCTFSGTHFLHYNNDFKILKYFFFLHPIRRNIFHSSRFKLRKFRLSIFRFLRANFIIVTIQQDGKDISIINQINHFVTPFIDNQEPFYSVLITKLSQIDQLLCLTKGFISCWNINNLFCD